MLGDPVMKKFVLALASLAMVAGSASVASAHHSTANYDNQHSENVKVVVKELEMTNPHMRLTAVSGTKTLVFEGQSVQNMYRMGLRRGMINPGDSVTINYSPLKAGNEGYAGLFWALTLADGKMVGRPRENAPGAAPA